MYILFNISCSLMFVSHTGILCIVVDVLQLLISIKKEFNLTFFWIFQVALKSARYR